MEKQGKASWSGSMAWKYGVVLTQTFNGDCDSFACLGLNILQLIVSLPLSPFSFCNPPYFFIGLVCLSPVCLSFCVCLFLSSHIAVSVSQPCVVYFICCQHFSCRRNRFLFCTRAWFAWLLFCFSLCCCLPRGYRFDLTEIQTESGIENQSQTAGLIEKPSKDAGNLLG